MVRTKASVNSSVRVAAAKAPRKNVAGTSRSSIDALSPVGKKDKSVGGNPVCPRPTPDWQKSIGSFFTIVSTKEEENGNVESPKEMVIETAPELSHDDKENKNPNDQAGTSSNKDPVVDDEPGPSTSGSSAPNKKRRRILQLADSDSEEEQTKEPHKMSGCVVSVEDEIMTC
ncbi:uncharacterized protein LOC143460209 [Clavelina lepadiformis]|uniref:uncharacterized protein LOC143460209 n=1 Tax=Clavelina lepadiformis TaxID=159417 RepID=UPI0040436B4E